jgi:hypothetical protein
MHKLGITIGVLSLCALTSVTPARSEAKNCDSMWMACVNAASGVMASLFPAAGQAEQLRCDHLVMACRNSGVWLATGEKMPPNPGPCKDCGGTKRAGATVSKTVTGATSTPVFGGKLNGQSAVTASNSPSGTSGAAPKAAAVKPATVPPQLAERLNRLQQQRQ